MPGYLRFVPPGLRFGVLMLRRARPRKGFDLSSAERARSTLVLLAQTFSN
jgi:hypothetical protein